MRSQRRQGPLCDFPSEALRLFLENPENVAALSFTQLPGQSREAVWGRPVGRQLGPEVATDGAAAWVPGVGEPVA